MKLTAHQKDVLKSCVGDNGLGRVGWSLQTWENAAKHVCNPLIRAGLLEFMRLGGYPGVKITPAGRKALEEAGDA